MKAAIAKGNTEGYKTYLSKLKNLFSIKRSIVFVGARIYAQNAIREKNQGLNFLRLASRIDAVSSRLETAIRMQQVNAAMGQTVKGMSNVMKSMEVDKIAKTMEQFEKQFEDMDVRSGYMESTMESTTALTTPPEQVDALIQVNSLNF